MNTAVTTATLPTPLSEPRRIVRTSTDPRAARTRAVIVDAFRALVVADGPAPTVSDVVRRAGVSRSSFYLQFASVDELAAVLLRDALVEIETADVELRRDREVSGSEVTRRTVERLVAQVDAHRGLYRLGLAASFAGHPEVLEALTARIREAIALIPGAHGGLSPVAESVYVAGGMLALLRSWVSGELDVTAAGVVRQILALLPPWTSTSA